MMKRRFAVLPFRVVADASRRLITRDLFVRSAGCFPNAKNHGVRREKGLPECILQFCVSGEGWAEIGGKKMVLYPGEVVLIPPNIPHAYGAVEDNPWTNYWIHFRGKQCEEYLNLLAIKPETPLLSLPEDSELVAQMENLLELYQEGCQFSQILKASSLMRSILTQLYFLKEVGETRKTAVGKVEGTIRYMQMNWNRMLNLEELADRVSLSRGYYHALFKKRTGYAPLDYFIQLKMQKAANLLCTTELRIDEIGGRLGYDNPLYFSRLFKKIMGIAPSYYRKQFRSGFISME